ncbi:transposase [Streptomyces sp. NPDC001404]|uniref:transposase n=1 Tax=Streptomyces sp. NPDC001404 TaxID=3364571 RepID=UPI0036922427
MPGAVAKADAVVEVSVAALSPFRWARPVSDRADRAGEQPGRYAAVRVRDRLDRLWCDEDFVGWPPRGGRPGISPARLPAVCVLQFLLGLPDRQAAEAVRCHIDFKAGDCAEAYDAASSHGPFTPVDA